MSFLYPNMLFALIALLIPLAIHLFNFRRHKVIFFSNTAILKTIEQENAKTKKLKYLVVLILRMLFVAALVLAFAYPYKHDERLSNDTETNLVAVYIDNSMSMQSLSSEISLFEDARNSARKLVSEMNPTQRFVLMTNSRVPDNEYPMSRDEMLLTIDNIQPEAPTMSFAELYDNVSMIKKRNDFESVALFAYSDFQKGMMTIAGLTTDSSVSVVALPVYSDFQSNIFVDSVWLRSPVLQNGLSNEIGIRIVNEGGKDVKGVPVTLDIDGQKVAFSSVDIPAYSGNDLFMQFVLDNVGFKKATVSVNDYPITFDDNYYFTLNVRPVIKVMELIPDDVASECELLFDNDPLFIYEKVNPLKLDRFSIVDYQMIIVNQNASLNENVQQSLFDFAAQGGSLLVLPPLNADNYFLYKINGINIDKEPDTVTVTVDALASQHAFFEDVLLNVPDNADLPEVYRHYPMRLNNNSNALTLIGLQNGEPLMLMSRDNNGAIYYLSSSFDSQYSALSQHAIFVPLMYKMAFLGGGLSKLSYTIGVDNSFNINGNNLLYGEQISIVNADRSFSMIPAVDIRNNRSFVTLTSDLPESGFYEVLKNGESVSVMAWNDNRKESELKFLNEDEIAEVLNENDINLISVVSYDDMYSDGAVGAFTKKSSLWKYLVLLSLCALLGEVLVLRLWK